jgi:cytosine deaminase
MNTVNPFLHAAIEEAERDLSEGGIPIGSVLVRSGAMIGRGHNRRVQKGSVILHGEMDALENVDADLPRSIVSAPSTRRFHRAPCAAAPFCPTASHGSWSARTNPS